MNTYSTSNPCRSAFPLVLFAALVLAQPTTADAQSLGRVTGSVKEGETGGPLVGATVLLRDATDSTHAPIGAVTDKKGVFSIERIPLETRYRLEVRSVGYEPYVRENIQLSETRTTVDIGEIVLRQQALQGGEVQVTAKRDMVSILPDKTVYAVEDNPSYTATNVSDLLGQIPTVTVDQDGKVSLRGNENVTIMMNDRPLTMPAEQRNKFLQSLPADMVKDIEIRTNPGAQFDAKNQGGIINIVTRKTMSDMLGGNVNAGIDTRVGGNGGGGFYYNGENLTASVGGGLYRGPGHGTNTSMRINYLDTNERRYSGEGTSESASNSWYTYGQIDYHITKNDIASLSFNFNQWSSNYTSIGTQTFYNANDAIVGRLTDSTIPDAGTDNSGGYNNASLLLKHTFEGDHQISLDVSYNSFGYSSGNNYTSTYTRVDGTIDSIRSSSRTSFSERTDATLISSLKYENPLTEQTKLSLGGKVEMNDLDNTMQVSNRDRQTGEFVPDTLQSNHYLPDNSIYAIYGNLGFLPFEGINVQAGIRVEHALVSARYATGEEIVSRTYTNLFPSGAVTYTLAEAHSLTLSYRRSIALPDIDALNPTRIRWNDLYEYSGNPDLTPEFTQSVELAYNTYWGMGNMISLSPYYSTTTGNIEQSEQILNNTTYSSSRNFNGTYSIGTEMSFSMRPVEWFNLRLSGDLYRKVNRGSDIPGDIYSAALGYSGSASVNLDLMEGLTFSTSVFTRSPAAVGGSRPNGFIFWNCSLRQRLLDNKLNISLRLNDPLDMQKWHNVYSSPQFYSESTSKWTSRYLGLNISYNFGTTPRMETHQQEKTETKGSGGSSGGGSSSGQGGGQ
jgi:outer membrane receptor protein involved in Fe transport